jgi:hypothetical protein
MPNDSLLLSCLYVVGGLAALAWGADRFVTGAAALARSLGLSTLLVGIVIVGIGTSALELLVSANAAYQGNPGLAVGNALGSNIANGAGAGTGGPGRPAGHPLAHPAEQLGIEPCPRKAVQQRPAAG